jgi:Trk-type K+ transport system membrane component
VTSSTPSSFPEQGRAADRPAAAPRHAAGLEVKTSRQDGNIDQFRPSVPMGSFVVWMLLLLFGFGLVAHALGGWFSPPADFEQALFIVGSALCTVGLSCGPDPKTPLMRSISRT